jgi:hypothetical protein
MKHLIAAMFFVSFSAWSGPILVGQGVGESEYALIFTRNNLPELINSCKSVCALSAEQKDLLAELAVRGINPPAALFKTKSELGSDVYRLHKSGLEVWFNQDELWLNQEKTAPYSIPYATAVWLDVLSSIKPVIQSGPDLEQIKSELLLILSQRMIPIAGRMADETPLTALIWKSDKEDRFYIRNSEFENYDFTPALMEALTCPAGAGAAGELRVNTARWTLLTRVSDEGALRVRLDTVLNWRCGNEGQRGRAMIVLMAPPAENGSFRIDPATVQVYLQGE